jgi:hypothetical protein
MKGKEQINDENPICRKCAFFDVKEGCALERDWQYGDGEGSLCKDFMLPEEITLPASDSRYTIVHDMVDVWMKKYTENDLE